MAYIAAHHLVTGNLHWVHKVYMHAGRHLFECRLHVSSA